MRLRWPPDRATGLVPGLTLGRMADLLSKLDEISEMVETAKSMPLSASCVVNRTELLAALDEVRDLLPQELQQAQWVIGNRDDVVDEGRREADRIIAEAYRERARLISLDEVAEQAQREAEEVLDEARRQAAMMRHEVEEYVDARLANFEVVLQKTLAAVHRGREKLRGRHELDALRDGDGYDDPPLPG